MKALQGSPLWVLEKSLKYYFRVLVGASSVLVGASSVLGECRRTAYIGVLSTFQVSSTFTLMTFPNTVAHIHLCR